MNILTAGTDASGQEEGGFLFTDFAMMLEDVDSGKAKRSWFSTTLLQPTEARGRCISFKFNIQDGFNLDMFQLMKVDILSRNQSNKHSAMSDGEGFDYYNSSVIIDAKSVFSAMQKSSQEYRVRSCFA